MVGISFEIAQSVILYNVATLYDFARPFVLLLCDGKYFISVLLHVAVLHNSLQLVRSVKFLSIMMFNTSYHNGEKVDSSVDTMTHVPLN